MRINAAKKVYILFICMIFALVIFMPFQSLALPPDVPVLTAFSEALEGYPILIKTNDTDWTGKVTKVTSNGTDIGFSKDPRGIMLDSLSAGTSNLIFTASGYNDANLSQTVKTKSGSAALTIVSELSSETVKFTESELNTLYGLYGNVDTYSSYNTYPSQKNRTNAKCIPLDAMFGRMSASATKASDDNIITVKSNDNFTATFKWSDLFTDKRYYYPDGKTDTGKKQVYPSIADLDDEDGTFVFGQLVPQDQTNDSFVKYIKGGTITISKEKAKAFTAVTLANVASDSKVPFEQKISFTLPKENGRAKVYYTLDGSIPNTSSKMYNFSEFQPLKPVVLNAVGSVTINTIVIGRGGLDSKVTSFKYIVEKPVLTPAPAKSSLASATPKSLKTPKSSKSPKASKTPKASPTPTKKPPKNTILTVVDERNGDKAYFTLADLNKITDKEGNKTYSFSAYNTFPSWKTTSLRGPSIKGILSKGGLKSISSSQMLTIKAKDGYATRLSYGEITQSRYYFPSGNDGTANGNSGGSSARSGKSSVRAIIGLNKDDGTFAIGQLYPHEQTYDAFVKGMKGGKIVIEKSRISRWPRIKKTDPDVETPVFTGDIIKFILPNIGRGKVYYTMDGSTPNENSAMYNISAWKQSGGPDDNYPVIATEGQTTIKAIVKGHGKAASGVSEFIFNATASPSPSPTPSPTPSATQSTVPSETPASETVFSSSVESTNGDMSADAEVIAKAGTSDIYPAESANAYTNSDDVNSALAIVLIGAGVVLAMIVLFIVWKRKGSKRG